MANYSLRECSPRLPSSFSTYLVSTIKLLSFFLPQSFFRRLSLCNLPSNASSRDHSRDPFFQGREKTPSRRNHSASKTASNTGGTYSCILAEIFFQRNLIVRFFLEKSHFSLLFNFIRVSPGRERLSLRLWLLTTGLRFCDMVDQGRDDFKYKFKRRKDTKKDVCSIYIFTVIIILRLMHLFFFF